MVRSEEMKQIKKIQQSHFTVYKKKSFKGALTYGKLTGISVFNAKQSMFMKKAIELLIETL